MERYFLNRNIALRDGGIVAAVTILSLFGLAAILSISAGRNDGKPLRHAFAIALGSVCMYVVGRLKSTYVHAAALPWYITCLALLTLVLVAGEEVRGTKGWLFIGSFSLQPVEYMKVGLILMLASSVGRMRIHASQGRNAYVSALVTLPPVILTLLQPDLGSAIVLAFIGGIFILLHATWRARIFLFSLAVLAGMVSWLFFFQPHQKERILVLVDSSRDPFGAGYNIRQSIIAVGSGKLLGRGIGAGSQSQLHFLPEAATDFAFALIAEELGFAGASILILCFIVLFVRVGYHLARAPDDFSAYVLFGIGGWWFFQSSVYLGMNMGLAPVVGIPLPFVSYGGTSLIASFMAAGCVLAVCGVSSVGREEM